MQCVLKKIKEPATPMATHQATDQDVLYDFLEASILCKQINVSHHYQTNKHNQSDMVE